MIGIVTQQPREIDFLAKIFFFFFFWVKTLNNVEKESIVFVQGQWVSLCWRVRFSIPSLVCNIE